MRFNSSKHTGLHLTPQEICLLPPILRIVIEKSHPFFIWIHQCISIIDYFSRYFKRNIRTANDYFTQSLKYRLVPFICYIIDFKFLKPHRNLRPAKKRKHQDGRKQ